MSIGSGVTAHPPIRIVNIRLAVARRVLSGINLMVCQPKTCRIKVSTMKNAKYRPVRVGLGWFMGV
jgi:hypothetical protein